MTTPQTEIVVNVIFGMTESDLAAMREPFLAMQAASRAENGCQDYTFSVELDSPTTIRITERWDDFASLTAHFATPHMATFQAAMATHPPVDMNASFFEVNEIDRPV